MNIRIIKLLAIAFLATSQIESKRMSPEAWAEAAYQERLNTPSNQTMLTELYENMEKLIEEIQSCPAGIEFSPLAINSSVAVRKLKKFRQELNKIKHHKQNSEQLKKALKELYRFFIELDNQVKARCQGIAV